MPPSYLTPTCFFAFRSTVAVFPVDAFGMLEWQYVLVGNILFELGLLIIIYAMLFRRASADARKPPE